MAWTAPRTWVSGELVTAAIGNVHWRDNLSYLKARTDTLISGAPFVFGGNPLNSRNIGTSYVSGATYASLVPSTRIVNFDPTLFSGIAVQMEAMLLAISGATATLALFNLTGAPNTALTGSQITSTDATGVRVRSGNITLPSGGSALNFGVKLHSGHAAIAAAAWGITFLPVD